MWKYVGVGRNQVPGDLDDLYPMDDDAMTWKHLVDYWPFMRGTTSHQWIPLTNVQ